jgi:RES domain
MATGDLDRLQPNRSKSRWSNGRFDVLHTSLDRDGAIAAVHALLSLQPVLTSKIEFFAHCLRAAVQESLQLMDLQVLARLRVVTDRYAERDYDRTQEIADAAFFLGFGGLFVPGRVGPAAMQVCSPTGSNLPLSRLTQSSQSRSTGRSGAARLASTGKPRA